MEFRIYRSYNDEFGDDGISIKAVVCMSILKEIVDGFKKGIHNFGSLITQLINTILLSIVYLFGVGVTAMIARFAGKDFLELKIKAKKSYWHTLNVSKKDIKKFYRQF